MPQRRWLVCALDSFHAKIGSAFFLDDCSVLTISERTRASITQASDAVFVPAKSRSTCFHLVTAVATVDDLPNNFITLHAVALPNLSRL